MDNVRAKTNFIVKRLKNTYAWRIIGDEKHGGWYIGQESPVYYCAPNILENMKEIIWVYAFASQSTGRFFSWPHVIMSDGLGGTTKIPLRYVDFLEKSS